MKIGWQRILSMAFLVVALVMFTAMHFLPLWDYGPGPRGWELWVGIWEMMRVPRSFGEPRNAVTFFSFLAFSLLIVASPFLGNVWVKSLLAWSVVVIFSGVAAAGVWVIAFKELAGVGYSSGLCCLIVSPVLNFVGLLLARPQWLKKSGLPLPPEAKR